MTKADKPNERVWAPRVVWRGLWLALICIVAGCTPPAAGTFEAVFEWPDQTPTDPLWVWATVERRQRVDEPGIRIAESQIERFVPGLRLAIDDVPNRDRLVVVAALNNGPSRDATTVYYGESDFFSLEPGRHTEVLIRLHLVPTPARPSTLKLVEAVSSAEDDRTYVNRATVTLAFEAPHATIAIAANDVAFWRGLTERPLSELEREGDGDGYLWSGWNLDAGLCGPESCPDGLRAVFLKLRNAQGYESEVASTPVTLDTRPPRVEGAHVSYQPRPDNPLSIVNAARDGTLITVTFQVDEPLSTDPSVSAALGAEVLTLDRLAGETSSGFFTYTLTLDPTHAAFDGRYALTAELQDLAGNRHVDAVGGTALVIDRTPPDATLAVDVCRLKHLRVPWGAEQTGYRWGQYLTDASTTATDDPTQVLLPPESFKQVGETLVEARIYTDETTGWHIGTSVPVAEGWRSVELLAGDSTQTWVSVIDHAGNQSTRVRVANVEWVVTLGGKVPGRLFENPTVLTTTPRFGHQLEQPAAIATEPAMPEIGKVMAPDGQVLTEIAEPAWTRRARTGLVPGARRTQSLVYDTARGKTVLVGGVCGAACWAEDVLEWDGDRGTWTERVPTDIWPPPRRGSQTTYDGRRGTVVLFGGVWGGRPFNDIWEWDGTRGTWTDRTLEADKPAPRRLHSLVYDSARGQVVMFGGWDLDKQFNDIWVWDPVTGIWTDQTPAFGDAPVPRRSQSMVYDVAQDKIVLFGGWDGIRHLDDTWEWDPTRATWTLIEPSGPSPPGRVKAGSAYDPVRKRVVLMGGRGDAADSDGEVLNDLWEWDGTTRTWTQRVPGGIRPTPRRELGFVFDSGRQKFVLFGGSDDVEELSDLWEWDPATVTWTQRAAPDAESPPARSMHALACNQARDQSLLFGGRDADSIFGDTWLWDVSSRRWKRWVQQGPAPTPRYGHAMVGDPRRGRIVLFGGRDSERLYGDTWAWNDADRRWIEQPATVEWPSPRSEHAMAYDERRGVITLFGGGDGEQHGSDTWEWDGDAWTARPIPSPETIWPSIRSGHAMAYDAKRHHVTFFGGWPAEPYWADHWEWDGLSGRWAVHPPLDVAPEPRTSHVMAADRSRNTVILFGGVLGDPFSGQYMNDVREWDGGSRMWTQREPAGERPLPRIESSFVDCGPDGEAFLFGGETMGAEAIGDSWTFDNGASQRPAIVWKVPLTAAGMPSDLAFDHLTIKASAGGTGHAGGANPQTWTGAVMHVWDTSKGAWRIVALATTSARQPSVLAFNTSGDGVQPLRFGPRETVTIAIAPLAAGGRDKAARVAVDFLEARLRYGAPPGCQ